MKRKIFALAVAAAVLFTLAFAAGCDTDTDGYTFVVPDGAPALGVVNILDGTAIDGVEKPEIVPSNTISTRAVQADIAVVPANLAANLYNRGQDVKLVGTLTHGNLYVLGANADDVAQLSDLEGKLVCSIGQNSVPDFVFRKLLADAGLEYATGDAAQAGKVTVRYFANGSEVVQQLIQAKDSGSALIGVLAEPAVTNAKTKGLSELFDLQALWQKASGGEVKGYSQAVLIVKSKVAEDEAVMSALISALEANGDFVIENSERVAEIIAAAYPQSSFAGQTFGTATLERCNCGFVSAADGRQAYETMLNAIMDINPQAIGGKLPDVDFYYGG